MASSAGRVSLDGEALESLARELAGKAGELSAGATGVRGALTRSGLPSYAYDARRAAGDVEQLAGQLLAWSAALRGRAALTRMAADQRMPWLLNSMAQMERTDPRGAFSAFASAVVQGGTAQGVEELFTRMSGFAAIHGLMPAASRSALLESLAYANQHLISDYFSSAATKLFAEPLVGADAAFRGSATAANKLLSSPAFGALVDAGLQGWKDYDERLSDKERAGRIAVAGLGGLATGAFCIAVGLGTFGVGGVACAVGAGIATGVVANTVNETYMPSDAEEAKAARLAEINRALDNVAKLDAFYEEYGNLTTSDREYLLSQMPDRDRMLNHWDNELGQRTDLVLYRRRDGSIFARQILEPGTDRVLATRYYGPDGETRR